MGRRGCIVTAIADLLTRADHDRLTLRLRELRELDAMVRERGTMASVPEPPAVGQMATKETTT
jgi:hypothetical protein